MFRKSIWPLRRKLVFDVGMHNGDDTAEYLRDGYRVIAVEANPQLATEARSRFENEIAAGLLVIENVGIHHTRGSLPFYVNRFAQWSSFVEHLGCRGGVFSVVDVPTITINDLIEKHGMPYYLKVDIEGMDGEAIRQLGGRADRPRYFSVEDGGRHTLDNLLGIGAKRIKFSDQLQVSRTLGEARSGPFGEDLPGNWLSPGAATEFYLSKIRPVEGEEPLGGRWWDIHALFG